MGGWLLRGLLVLSRGSTKVKREVKRIEAKL